VIRPYKEDMIVFLENFCCSEVTVCHYNNDAMKTIPFDPESYEEYDET